MRRPELVALEQRLLLTADSTLTLLTASSAHVASGQSLTLRATVNDGTTTATIPSGGTVTFRDGDATLGTAALVAGEATLATSLATAGTHDLSATYGGTTDFAASGSDSIPSGPISTIAGIATSPDTPESPTGDGGRATAAIIGEPSALASDAQGDLFIADSVNSVIREVTPDGIIHTVAGIADEGGDAGDGGPATAAQINAPYALAVDAAGDLFFNESGDGVIREVTPDGIIHTYAGFISQDGVPENGDGGPATAAQIGAPSALAVDAKGNLFIADGLDSLVREVTPDGIIHTVAGPGQPAGPGQAGATGDGGPATQAPLGQPSALAVDAAGDLFIGDSLDYTVREVTPDGIIHTVAGLVSKQGDTGDGGPATAAQVGSPNALAVDAVGDLFIADTISDTIREVTPDGIIRTVAGVADEGGDTGDGGPATAAHISDPFGLVATAGGALDIADIENGIVRQVGAGLPVIVGDYFTVTAGSSSVTAGDTETVTVTADKPDGTVDTAYAGTVDLSSNDPMAVLPAGAALSAGVGTFTVTLRTAGSRNIIATDAALPTLTGSSAAITVDPGAATQLAVPPVGFVPGPVAGVAYALTVQAEDAYGNLVPTYNGPITLSSTDPRATLPTDTTLTDGTGTFAVTFRTAGVDAVTIGTTDPTLTGTTDNLDVGANSPTHFVVTPPTTTADVAGTKLVLTVTLVDDYGNTYDLSGTLTPTSTDPNVQFLDATDTFDDGVGTVNVVLKTAGTQTVTVTDTDFNIAGTSAPITVVADSSTPTLVFQVPSTVQAGIPLPLSIRLEDGHGNLLTDADGPLLFGSGDPQAILSGEPMLVDGVANFTLTLGTVGPVTVTLVGGGTTATFQESVTPGTPTLLVLTGPATVNSGQAATYTVTAYDEYHNVAGIGDGPLGITSTAATATLPTDVTLQAGSTPFTATLNNLGTQTITVADPAHPGLSASFTTDVNGITIDGPSPPAVDDIGVIGHVFLDLDGTGVPTANDPGLAGRVVYLDLNDDGIDDDDEPTTTTNSTGGFSLFFAQPAGTTPEAAFAATAPLLREALGQDATGRLVTDRVTINADGSVGVAVATSSALAPVATAAGLLPATPSTDPDTAFVAALYRSVLGRQGSTTEVAGWVAAMQAGASRGDVAAGFVDSLEYRTDEVAAYYREFLGRGPDPTSSFFVTGLMNGVGESAVVAAIVGSSEYQADHAGTDGFVAGLYNDVLGREGDQTGVAAFQSALAAGTTPATVATDFATSAEANDQAVAGFYQAFLHRQSASDPLATWDALLDAGTDTISDVAIGILSSDEFLQDALAGRS